MRTKLIAIAIATGGLIAAQSPSGRAMPTGEAATILAPLELCHAGARPAVAGRGTALLLAQGETRPFTADVVPPGAAAEGKPPLFDDLGTLTMPVTTASAEAQAYFDQGLRLSYAFNHAEARRAFRAAQQLDPECAMCFWGEALVLGPNINAPMFPDALAPALAALARAQVLAGRASERERALIDALARRYSDRPDTDRAALDAAYADAMNDAAARFRDDDDIQVLYAEALMDLSPWDYWEAGGERPKGRTADIVAALERVLARNPDHPGAIHLYIHAVEASAAPERALPHARRLAALMPGAGHIVHMPGHIYYRLGLYREALEANIAAVAADERYFERSPSDPFYRNGYYPHNLHFLMAAAQMGGDAASALEAAAKLDRLLDEAFVRSAASLQPIKAAPYFAHAQFSAPRTVLALPEPGDALILVKALWHYARALAHAESGEHGEVGREIDALGALQSGGDFDDLHGSGVPGRAVVEIARLVATARLADARGELAAAAAAYRAAIAVQDGLAYMEPPFWYYPVRQSLGAVLLRSGELDAAEAAFHDSLARSPNNGWALYGLKEVYRQRGDDAAERAVGAQLERAWFGDPALLDLERL